MSQNMRRRAVEYRVKVGARNALQFTILQDTGAAAKDLTSTDNFSTGKFKVWKPDGTLVINGTIGYTDRPNGLVTYSLTAADTVAANVGVWEGEIELYNSSSVLTEQTTTFLFIIENSY